MFRLLTVRASTIASLRAGLFTGLERKFPRQSPTLAARVFHDFLPRLEFVSYATLREHTLDLMIRD